MTRYICYTEGLSRNLVIDAQLQQQWQQLLHYPVHCLCINFQKTTTITTWCNNDKLLHLSDSTCTMVSFGFESNWCFSSSNYDSDPDWSRVEREERLENVLLKPKVEGISVPRSASMWCHLATLQITMNNLLFLFTASSTNFAPVPVWVRKLVKLMHCHGSHVDHFSIHSPH